jgi:hypothetical protein
MVLFHNTRSNDNGVSEAIGFMLIFGIVIAGIGLVTLYGYPLLIQQQVSADEKIMEKNMIVLQNDLKSLAYKTVPFKETSLKIGGGSLTVYNSSYTPSIFTMDITDQAGNSFLSNPLQSGDLRYESVSSQTDISLQNGAVVMRPRLGQGSAMLAEPSWYYDANTQTMVINLINITSTDIMAKEGIGTVQMTLGETNYTYVPVPPASNPVLVKYTPNPLQDYSVAWDNYFIQTLGMIPDGSPGVYQLPYTNTLVIKKYEVQIKSI